MGAVPRGGARTGRGARRVVVGPRIGGRLVADDRWFSESGEAGMGKRRSAREARGRTRPLTVARQAGRQAGAGARELASPKKKGKKRVTGGKTGRGAVWKPSGGLLQDGGDRIEGGGRPVDEKRDDFSSKSGWGRGGLPNDKKTVVRPRFGAVRFVDRSRACAGRVGGAQGARKRGTGRAGRTRRTLQCRRERGRGRVERPFSNRANDVPIRTSEATPRGPAGQGPGARPDWESDQW